MTLKLLLRNFPLRFNMAQFAYSIVVISVIVKLPNCSHSTRAFQAMRWDSLHIRLDRLEELL